MLDAAAIARLRAMLGPGPDRYDFATVMQRWAAEALGEPLADISLTQAPGADQFDWPSGSTCREVDALARQLIRLPPGRPRADVERDAALMLGVIFHEYTGMKPTRVYDAHGGSDRVSLFYYFASEAFRAIGLEPNWDAFREAGKEWEKLPKRAMRQRILQGGGASTRRKSER
jgi:hypothetical protein